MSASDRALELIEDGIVAHGGDLGGWTRREEGALQVFDGRVTLHVKIAEAETSSRQEKVHAHVQATVHDHDEVLDACVIGLGDDQETALQQIAMIWITTVAGPIKSLLDNKPVCMTCQAGVADGDISQGYSPDSYGLSGVRAYVGPAVLRGIDDNVSSALDGSKPWFEFATTAAAPRRLHLAKVTIQSKGKDGWSRNLEIDGHEVCYHDPNWPAGVQGPDFGYLTRFAVFEFPANSNVIARRAELEQTIEYFAEHYGDHESVDDLMAEMVRQGFRQELVDEVESYSTIAFGRTLFEHRGLEYPTTVIRARKDGRVETGIPLMSIPAFTRAKAMAPLLYKKLGAKLYQALCLYNAESNAIMKVIDKTGKDIDLSHLTLYPTVVPDRGVSDETMDAAIEKLHEMIEAGKAAREGERVDAVVDFDVEKDGTVAERREKKPWWKVW